MQVLQQESAGTGMQRAEGALVEVVGRKYQHADTVELPAPDRSQAGPLPASVLCNENRRTTGLAHAGRADSSAVRSACIPAGRPSSTSPAISAPYIF